MWARKRASNSQNSISVIWRSSLSAGDSAMGFQTCVTSLINSSLPFLLLILPDRD
jgi:hypothetical protein